jgi:MoxR-like ATPase
MARRITPIAVRCSSIGKYEVLTASGSWVPTHLLPDYNEDVVFTAMRGRDWPAVGETVQLSDRNTPNEVPPPFIPDEDFTAPVNEADQPDQDGPTNKTDGPTTAPTNKDGSMTIEDIVRRIAGELDDTMRGELNEALDVVMDDKIATALAEYSPEIVQPTNEVRTVTAHIEVKMPTVTLSSDGLFHKAFPDLLFNIQAGIHTFLPGSPGTGKTHSVGQAADLLGYPWAGISLGPTTPESRLVGGMTANGEFFEPRMVDMIRHASQNPDSGAIVCLDEMDNGHAGILATLNTVLANGFFEAPCGEKIPFGNNLVFVACANTYGTGPTSQFAGRNKLDAATLDRFSYLPWEIDEGLEDALVRRFFSDDEQTTASAWLDVWRTARANVATHGLNIFVTPRGAQTGARMVAAGRDIDKALMMTLGNKIPADQWAKINPL